MKALILAGSALALAAAAVAFVTRPTQSTPLNTQAKDLYAFSVKTIEGKDQKLSAYKGKVVLAVNVASKCGLTPQYKGLQALYEKYKDKGLVILGFPANEFNGQEPGTNEEIAEFCSANYGVTFPMFEKIVVKGKETHPLYQWLLASTENKNDIEWNFAKFLIGKDGKVIARYKPQTTPENQELIQAIEKALEG